MKFTTATNKRAKLRLAIAGLPGSGKTWTSLSIAQGLVPGGRVAVIDTERGSASLYANKFPFDVLELEKHGASDYIEAIELASSSGYDVIVIDSLSHAWINSLEQVDQIAERGSGNSFTAWRKVSPAHNKLIDSILSCPTHVITTMRSKVEYALQDNEKGKKEPKKIGLAPVQRAGVEYEMTIWGDLDLEHRMLISKSRADAIQVGETIDRPGEVFARRLRAWLDDGAEPTPVAPPEPTPTPAPTSHASAIDDVFATYLKAMESAATLVDLDAVATGQGKPAKGTPEHAKAIPVYVARKEYLTRAASDAKAASEVAA